VADALLVDGSLDPFPIDGRGRDGQEVAGVGVAV
jgi:hypothetical protein